jgi:hypothetical protein
MCGAGGTTWEEGKRLKKDKQMMGFASAAERLDSYTFNDPNILLESRALIHKALGTVAIRGKPQWSW